jgi:MinD-like ATPase involved in chromosome partitioning or flagellar assembly
MLVALRDVLARERAAGVWRTGVWAPGEEGSDEPWGDALVGSPSVNADRGSGGRVVAVWGPAGAPGHTTVVLVDADTYGPSIALALGLVDDASGLSVVCRHADNGTLTNSTLLSAAHRVRDDWFVVAGISRPDRWADLRPSALDQVWNQCRACLDVTVVDVGFCLEADDGSAWASRRNAAAVRAMATAERVIAVADSSALGAARLVARWSGARKSAPLAEFRVVQNRTRSRFREHADRWADGVRELGVAAPIHPVPLDARAAERCWSAGRSVGEKARHSPLRRALGAVAQGAVSR